MKRLLVVVAVVIGCCGSVMGSDDNVYDMAAEALARCEVQQTAERIAEENAIAEMYRADAERAAARRCSGRW